MSDRTPLNPGSDEALARGCTCPALDNGHGSPRHDPQHWVMTLGCPVHTPYYRENE